MKKILDITLKDLTRSMRSTFAILFMFGVPLLVTGMFYLMFGNIANNESGFSLPAIHVAVANLDEGSPELQLGASQLDIPGDQPVDNLGQILLLILKNESLSDLFTVSSMTDASLVRDAVDKGQADVGLIIPDDFSSTFSQMDSKAAAASVELYENPEKNLEAGIVQSVLSRFIDILSGAKIAAAVAAGHVTADQYSVIAQVVQNYLAESSQATADARNYITLESAGSVESPNRMLAIIGPIMAGMMIFYAFYTGMTTAETILREDEEGTLARMFTTPTPRAVILAGKFMAVFLTVLVQVVVLIIVSGLIFKIQWGDPFNVALISLGTVLAASSFGIFANSLIKSTKQGGIIYGGLLTVTGMVGMIKIFTLSVPGAAKTMEVVSLLVPQGWSIQGFLQSSSMTPTVEILPTLAVLLVWTVAFFSIGVWRFQKRFS